MGMGVGMAGVEPGAKTMITLIDDLTMPWERDMFGEDDAARSARPAPSRRPRILLAEDDDEMRRALAEVLRRARYDVVEAEHGVRVLDYIAASLIAGSGLDVDLVISDVRMPGADGLRLLSALRSHCQGMPVVLITAFGNAETHREAALRGALAVIDKPFDFAALLSLVRSVLPESGQGADE